MKKSFLEISQNSQENSFNKFAGLRKFLRTSFFTEYLGTTASIHWKNPKN